MQCGVRYWDSARFCTVSGSEIAYGAMRCAVLRQRMVLGVRGYRLTEAPPARSSIARVSTESEAW
eukprot:1756174-Rhodomonas_salina.1